MLLCGGPLGSWRLVIKADLRRLSCPEHGQRVEGVPFARHRARFTGDFESLVAWLATKMDKAAIQRLVRVDWDTVGRICERVVADELDPKRLDDLFTIGVDEISWKKYHNYLTLVANHRTGKIVWGHEDKNAATLDKFFNELGPKRSKEITAVSTDMGPAFAKSVRKKGHAPQAVICYDPFHVVKLATDALEKVRRAHWRELWDLNDKTAARKFKGARWALLKNPENLTATQAATLTRIRCSGGKLWRAYQRKEELRAIFAGDLNNQEVADMLDRWCARVQRSRLEPFVTAGRTIRQHREGILAAIALNINNGRLDRHQRCKRFHLFQVRSGVKTNSAFVWPTSIVELNTKRRIIPHPSIIMFYGNRLLVNMLWLFENLLYLFCYTNVIKRHMQVMQEPRVRCDLSFFCR